MNTNTKIKDYFDNFPFPKPVDIEELIKNGLREAFDIADEINCIFPENPNKKIENVLIIGCGCNELIYHALRNPDINFTGIDFSDVVESHVLNVIKDKQLSNVSFIKDDFINYNDMKYDLVYACDVINFSPNPSKALNAITNSLNDQGAIVLSLPSSYYYNSIDLLKEKIRFLDLYYTNEKDIDYAFNLVKSLIAVHPSKVNIYESSISKGSLEVISKDNFVYRFLSPNNKTYNIYDLDKLLKKSGLCFQNWNDNASYFPQALFQADNPTLPNIIDRFKDKDILDIWDTILSIKGPHHTVQKHRFCARKGINLNHFKDMMFEDDTFIFKRPNQIISPNTSKTQIHLARTNYKRILTDKEYEVISAIDKPLQYKELKKTLDFSIERLNGTLQSLWEYSVISFYKDK